MRLKALFMAAKALAQAGLGGIARRKALKAQRYDQLLHLAQGVYEGMSLAPP